MPRDVVVDISPNIIIIILMECGSLLLGMFPLSVGECVCCLDRTGGRDHPKAQKNKVCLFGEISTTAAHDMSGSFLEIALISKS